ncbi:DUF1152 domain-containing protein [Pelagicoccus albus]|uniref:DUF1152 domain-containing protein n=1 Tax=Pelagicoccus albus TaxID=415222 RepID=A0A7X1B8F7_9BACT|nr:DUF1152 domain-containing protein [Pelagicoccus albus]MBC2607486.1 DUF1152 domain-containing protein [Pelagicoccus albus]
MDQKPKASLIEIALKSKRALIFGIGGGGDIIQAIPIANLLKALGLEKVIVGGVACQWWTPDGNPLSETWGTAVMGPTLYDVHELSPAKTLVPGIVEVCKESALGNRIPCEAHLSDTLPADSVVIASLMGGTQGLANSLKALVEAEQLDLIVGVDIGSDTFFDGENAMPAKTSLVDFMSMGALIEQEVPVLYGVSGYGGDGEMPLDELDVRVSRVMKAGGYLGAHGITQSDVLAMKEACSIYEDPVEPISWRAACGELGWTNVWTHGPWGTAVKVTPLASVMMFFDPQTVATSNSKGILALQRSTSLEEAETIYKEELKQYPESQLYPTIQFFPET